MRRGVSLPKTRLELIMIEGHIVDFAHEHRFITR